MPFIHIPLWFLNCLTLIECVFLVQMSHCLSMRFWWECCQQDTIITCDKR